LISSVFENTHFSAAPSPALVACVPVRAVCGAGDSDEGDSFEFATASTATRGADYFFTCTPSYADRTVAGARQLEA